MSVAGGCRVAAADLVDSSDDLLTIAVRYGYGSAEAFGRAFRAVHGVGPSDARRDGGPFRSQQSLRFRLTVEGTTPMHVRITDQPAIRLVGHATRVPLIHEGVNPLIAAHVAAIPMEEHLRLKAAEHDVAGGPAPGHERARTGRIRGQRADLPARSRDQR